MKNGRYGHRQQTSDADPHPGAGDRGQQTAAAILDRLRYQWVRYQFHVSLLPGRLAQGATEHLDIIDAVTSGDPVAAERTIREHFAQRHRRLHQLEDVAALDPCHG